MRRRIELDPRYRNRRLFTAERSVEYRIVNDIEKGRRDNFEPQTIAALEAAYDLAPGSIGRAYQGGELQPAPPLAVVEHLEDRRPAVTPEMDAAIERQLPAVLREVDRAMLKHLGTTQRRPGQKLTGEQIFPASPADAMSWDYMAPGRSIDLIAWLLASIWADEAKEVAQKRRNWGSG